MRVIVGSSSETKINTVKKTLENFYLPTEVKGVKSDSQVTDQPLDKYTTSLGAKNRARMAKATIPSADFWIGVEGGLEETEEGGYSLVCIAAVIDKKGKLFIGKSGGIKLPKEVSERVKNGEQFGVVIREYREVFKGDRKSKELINELVTRENSFKQAISNALITCFEK